MCERHRLEAFPNGQGYAGTREDWIDRCYGAEARLEALQAAVRLLIDNTDVGGEATNAFYAAKVAVEILL